MKQAFIRIETKFGTLLFSTLDLRPATAQALLTTLPIWVELRSFRSALVELLQQLAAAAHVHTLNKQVGRRVLRKFQTEITELVNVCLPFYKDDQGSPADPDMFVAGPLGSEIFHMLVRLAQRDLWQEPTVSLQN